MGNSGLRGTFRTLVILLLIFAVIASVVVLFDLPSYLATGTERLPSENAAGKALIVYDPGVMGMGARSANWMGTDLHSRGYQVDISGIRSPGIENATDADILIVIGPTYFSSPTEPVSAYLQTVRTKPDARMGVYVVSGLMGDDAGPRMINILNNRSVFVKSNSSVSAWDKEAEEKSYSFIFSILQ
jgi:flavorubredoxin